MPELPVLELRQKDFLALPHYPDNSGHPCPELNPENEWAIRPLDNCPISGNWAAALSCYAVGPGEFILTWSEEVVGDDNHCHWARLKV